MRRSVLTLALLLAATVALPAEAHERSSARIQELSRQIVDRPADAALRLERGTVFLSDAQVDSARRDFERAVRLAPDLLEAHLSLAVANLRSGDGPAALRSAEECLRIDPGCAEARVIRARVHADGGNTRLAIREMLDALPGVERPTPDHYLELDRWIERLGPGSEDLAFRALGDGLARLGGSQVLESRARELGFDPDDPDFSGRALIPTAPIPGRLEHDVGLPPDEPTVVTRGPYLQVGTPTSVILRWRTKHATDTRVRYGRSGGSLNHEIVDSRVTTEHEIEVSGLDPDTRYTYSIGTSFLDLQGGDSTHQFRTSPLPGSRGAARVWVIGDSGSANLSARRVRDAYLGWPESSETDVWLMLGDNAYNTGTDFQYQAAVFDMYDKLLPNTVLWPTRGNHDRIHPGPDNDYYDIFTLPRLGEAGGVPSGDEAYYSFDFANVHFICLDSEGGPFGGPAMLEWLVHDLEENSQEWTIAYWHHPPYTKGSHNSDSQNDSSGRLIWMREHAVPLLEEYGVDLVLSGHSHSYERSFLLDGHYGLSWTLADSMKVDEGDGRPTGDGAYFKPSLRSGPHEGAVFAVAGSSSKISGGSLNHPVMITSLNKLGSMVLDVRGAQLDARFLDDQGRVRDSFRIVKGSRTDREHRGAETAVRLRGGPNPFRKTTTLDYSLSAPGSVRISVFDVAGRLVATLLDEVRPSGRHLTTWDGRANDGRSVPDGVYLVVLQTSTERRSTKIVKLD